MGSVPKGEPEEHPSNDTNEECESQSAEIAELPDGIFGDQLLGGVSEKGILKASYSNESVVLTLEFLSNKHTKFLMVLIRMGILLGTALLGVEIWWRGSDNPADFLFQNTVFIINVSVAAPLIIMLLAVALFYLYRIYKVWRMGLHWSARRKRYCILGGINLLFEFLITVRTCSFFWSDLDTSAHFLFIIHLLFREFIVLPY